MVHIAPQMRPKQCHHSLSLARARASSIKRRSFGRSECESTDGDLGIRRQRLSFAFARSLRRQICRRDWRGKRWGRRSYLRIISFADEHASCASFSALESLETERRRYTWPARGSNVRVAGESGKASDGEENHYFVAGHCSPA